MRFIRPCSPKHFLHPNFFFVQRFKRRLLRFVSPPFLALSYLSLAAMSASNPSMYLLLFYIYIFNPSIVTSLHHHPHRQLDNGTAAPVHANAGPAYGPPVTPTKPFNNGAGFRIGGPLETPVRTTDQPEIALTQNPAYEARDFDLPFLRNFKGAAKFYRHTNDPAATSSTWGVQYDNENQTACGIPTNAYWLSGVAIHPFWLKYAGLDRMSSSFFRRFPPLALECD